MSLVKELFYYSYLVFEEQGEEKIHLWDHADPTSHFQEAIKVKHHCPNAQIVSAGFVFYNRQKEKWACGYYSKTLEMKSRPEEDTKLFHKQYEGQKFHLLTKDQDQKTR